jgi:hypothetical protein
MAARPPGRRQARRSLRIFLAAGKPPAESGAEELRHFFAELTDAAHAA